MQNYCLKSELSGKGHVYRTLYITNNHLSVQHKIPIPLCFVFLANL